VEVTNRDRPLAVLGLTSTQLLEMKDAAKSSYAAAYSRINVLGEDRALDFIAIACLARGDFGVDDLVEVRALVDRRHRGLAKEYLLSYPRLGQDLERGIEMILPRSGSGPPSRVAASRSPRWLQPRIVGKLSEYTIPVMGRATGLEAGGNAPVESQNRNRGRIFPAGENPAPQSPAGT
jgi:hypothetical protein